MKAPTPKVLIETLHAWIWFSVAAAAMAFWETWFLVVKGQYPIKPLLFFFAFSQLFVFVWLVKLLFLAALGLSIFVVWVLGRTKLVNLLPLLDYAHKRSREQNVELIALVGALGALLVLSVGVFWVVYKIVFDLVRSPTFQIFAGITFFSLGLVLIAPVPMLVYKRIKSSLQNTKLELSKPIHVFAYLTIASTLSIGFFLIFPNLPLAGVIWKGTTRTRILVQLSFLIFSWYVYYLSLPRLSLRKSVVVLALILGLPLMAIGALQVAKFGYLRGFLNKIWMYSIGQPLSKTSPSLVQIVGIDFKTRIPQYANTPTDCSKTVYSGPMRFEPSVKCSGSQAAAYQGKPNLVLISVDAERKDRLPIYGYRTNTTPFFLNEFAKTAVVFDWAFAPSSRTTPSISMIFTGKPFEKIRFDSYTGDTFIKLCSNEQDVFSTAKQQGYLTAAVAVQEVLDMVRTDAIDLKKAPPWSLDDPDVDRKIRDDALALLEELKEAKQQAPQKPVLLWLHFFSPHQDYYPHQGMPGKDVYDSEVAFADLQISKVYEQLKQIFPNDNTVYIYFADHGEGLGDKFSYFHGKTLYNFEISVPLLIKMPNVKAKRIKIPVSLLSLAPTLYQLMGFNHQSGSLLPLIFNPEQCRPGVVYMEKIWQHGLEYTCYSVVKYPYKLIYYLEPSSFELYNIEQDPQELQMLNPIPNQSVLDELKRLMLDAYPWINEP